MTNEYQRLDPRIQKWIYRQGWADLGNCKKAVPPILAGDRDVLISAATAAGKTEAFFLPACSAIADIQSGFGILYISPLKALINDQYRRLESLGDALEMPVTPWHGDVAQSKS
jgi:ATP-dependent Lhr-like helicase